jgi:GGDEF domain-containing protein
MFVFNSNSGDQELLLRRADQSMYLAKAAGGNRVHVFAPSAPGCTPTA